jgi:hypothetical protein
LGLGSLSVSLALIGIIAAFTTVSVWRQQRSDAYA